MVNKYSLDGPSDEPCKGCQRMEIHKRCPAHGTLFFMSGVPFFEGFEKNYLRMSPEGQQKYFDVVKEVFDVIRFETGIDFNE